MSKVNSIPLTSGVSSFWVSFPWTASSHKTNKDKKGPMKQSTRALTASVLTLAASATTLFGQGGPLVTIDENGNGDINGTPLPWAVAPDPTGGVTTSPVLIYTLPFPVTPGDVGLIEVNDPTRPLSDILRFVNVAGTTQSELIFYSDFSASDPPDALADTGLPNSPNAILIPEIGPEGNNGALWNPSPGLPGSNSAGAAYNIISDVPEPGTASLLLSGFGFLLAIRRFRRMDGSADSNLRS